MKKVLVSIVTVLVLHVAASAQDLQSIVPQVDKAGSAKEFQQLATQFEQLTAKEPNNWLSWYYAAYCNAKTGWLLQDDGERIEPFADKADQQLNKALTLIDTAKHKRELSEIYVVKSIIFRDRVYINTMTMGPKYGPDAARTVF